MKARKPGGLVEPSCGWQRGLELLMNGTCCWCFAPVEGLTNTAPLTWVCRDRCNTYGALVLRQRVQGSA